MMNDFLASAWPYVAALLPTVGILWLFVVMMKHIVEGDRRERAAVAQWEAEQDGLKHPDEDPVG
ncbi:hypothetical protein [Kytococcus sedentarius]|uniref:hypothetical protein n=1 Tax=Kytococcus sedentarius TaxID=1276 RepID=UPI0035BC4B3D